MLHTTGETTLAQRETAFLLHVTAMTLQVLQ